MNDERPWLTVGGTLRDDAKFGRQQLDFPHCDLTLMAGPVDTWYTRHRFGTALLLMIDDLLPENELDRCRCKHGVTPDPLDWSDPLSTTRVCVCIQKITQRDRLCDECREWCPR